MSPLDRPKLTSMFTNGPINVFPRMFLTASNGPIRACKGMFTNRPSSSRKCFRLLRMGWPEHGKMASMFPNGPSSPFLSDCFEWACWIMQSQYRRSWMGLVISSRECSDCFKWAHYAKPASMFVNGPGSSFRERFRLLRVGLPEHAKPASMLWMGPVVFF
jgi:hypothetical protein